MLQLAKVIAKALAHHTPEAIPSGIGDAIYSNPARGEEIVRLLFAETRKKRPKDNIISALAFMLEQALETSRWSHENHSIGAYDLAGIVRAAVLQALHNEEHDAEGALVVAQSFARARIELGDQLGQAIQFAMQSKAPSSHAGSFEQLEKTLETLADELEHDCFLIQEQIRDLLQPMPVEVRLDVFAALARSSTPSLREAIAGFALDPDPEIVKGIASILAQNASRELVSASTIGRLVTMRNWIDEEARPSLDAVVRAARQKGVQPQPRTSTQISEILVTPCDGAGSQSWFVILRARRKFSIAALLTKQGLGLRDAWVRTGLSARELDAFLSQVQFELKLFSSSLDCVAISLAHNIASALSNGERIPFGLLHFIEATGLAAVTARIHSPNEVIDLVLTNSEPSSFDEKAISSAFTRSKKWANSNEWLHTWFEESEAALAAVTRGKTKKQRIDNVLQTIMSDRRRYWGELLAWTALASRDDPSDNEARDFALVARELLGTRPLSDIPIAAMISQNTIEALRAQ